MSKRRPGEKGTGFHLFPDAWLGSEVSECGYAAKGLWADVLCRMWGGDPRGVMPGDLQGFCARLGMKDPDVAAVWWTKFCPLLNELEAANVFSRGEDVDSFLEPDAIVNRRMYRDWCKEIGRSENARRAAVIRHSRAKIDAKTCQIDAEEHAQPMREAGGDPVETQGLANFSGCAGDTQDLREICHSEPNLTEPNRTEPEKAGAVALAMDPPTVRVEGRSVFAKVIRLTGDTGPWRAWWRSAIKAFEAEGALHLVGAHAAYVEAQIEAVARGAVEKEISSPGRFLVSRVLASARERRIAMPDLPQ